MENGVVKVVAPIEDTPAARAGIMSGDLITHLDKEQILGLTLQEAVEKMRGPVNSPIYAHHRAQGRRRSLRGEGRPRRHSHQSGEVQCRGRRRRLHQSDDVQRADHGELAEGDRGSEEAIGPQAQGLPHRSAQQSGRPARPSHLGVRCLPRSRRHRADPRPQSRGDAALQRASRRYHRRPEDRGADQWRLGIGLGNRGRRIAGPSPGDHHRHAFLRQRVGADHHPARFERRVSASRPRATTRLRAARSRPRASTPRSWSRKSCPRS